MTRWNRTRSNGHRIQRIAGDHYRLSWTVDRYKKNSQLRFPTRYSRDTDEAGAMRFSKKWGCEIPTKKPAPNEQGGQFQRGALPLVQAGTT